MAQVRLETYQEFATPQPLGQLYKSVGIPFVSTLTLIFFLHVSCSVVERH